MTKENKEILIKRFKSLLWRLGAIIAIEGVGFIANNLGLFDLPPAMVVFIGLMLAEVTKYLNVNLPELKANALGKGKK